jgi:hypothetical protein
LLSANLSGIIPPLSYPRSAILDSTQQMSEANISHETQGRAPSSFVQELQSMRIQIGTIVIFAVLMISPRAASAETIFLQCGETSHTVDLTNNAVDNHPATINETAIDWEWKFSYPDGTTRLENRHIDRTTGTETGTYTTCFVSGGFRGTCKTASITPISCTKASAPAKKF